jgi:hypothetical protein
MKLMIEYHLTTFDTTTWFSPVDITVDRYQ